MFSTMVSGVMDRDMDVDVNIGVMVQYMKDTGRMTWLVERVD